jgi:hypothetical protein
MSTSYRNGRPEDAVSTSGPIALYPGNQHYFSYRGRPLILVSSGDIYYDLFSPRQDFREYLDTLATHRCNFTRIYPAGCTAFVPSDGTASLLPWVRLPGGLYDLDRWNPAYFDRLHAFMGHALERDVIVDACLFNGFTTAWQQINNYCWPLMPLNAANNIQGDGCRDMNQFTTLRVSSNVRRQKEYIRRICAELGRYDNLLYDTSDEPDCYGNIPADEADAWVEAMLEELRAADTRGHLIAQTHIPPLESRTGRDWCRDPRTSWTNAEYLRALKDLPSQYEIDKPFVEIETFSPGEHPAWNRWWSTMGLVVSGDVVAASRIHAWAFLVGGGGGFLEWSAQYHPGAPSDYGPQATILAQKKVLRDFLEAFDFAGMRRFTGFGGVGQEPSVTPSAWATAIAETGRQYALYLSHSSAVTVAGDWYNGYYAPDPGSHRDRVDLDLPSGSYRIDWVHPPDGALVGTSVEKHGGGTLRLETPAYEIDIALAVRRRGAAL